MLRREVLIYLVLIFVLISLLSFLLFDRVYSVSDVDGEIVAVEINDAKQKYSEYNNLDLGKIIVHMTYNSPFPKCNDTLKNIKSWERHFILKLWNEIERENYIKQKFALIYPLFKRLLPVMQADYFKYLILYEEGGIFTDLDTELLEDPKQWWSKFEVLKSGDFWNKTLIGIEDVKTVTPFAMFTIISMLPKQRVFLDMLNSILTFFLENNPIGLNVGNVLEITATLSWSRNVLSLIKDEDPDYNHESMLINGLKTKSLIIIPLPSFRSGLSIHYFQGSWAPWGKSYCHE